MAVKNPTSWLTQSGTGFVTNVGLLNLQDNLGNLLQDNLGNLLVINPVEVFAKTSTIWTGSGT